MSQSLSHIPGIRSAEPFVPHTLEHLTQAGVFPNPLPPAAYERMLKDYDALENVITSRITYDSDGLAVTGLVTEPADIMPGKHPLLIYNRGGSREYGKLTLLSVLRSMAPYSRKGYIVAASNYRGNDGGEGREEFGGSDVNDILNLIAIMKQHPGFDGKNVHIIGHSRGAMMTYLALRKGADVRSAIGLAGMSDVVATATARPDIEASVFKRLIGGDDSTRTQAYIDRSVTRWIDEINVPIQLHHGDADKSVDVSQSQLLATALHKAEKTCELHIYPGDNHALLRNWDTVISRTLDWMGRFSQ
jgi:dipeptidyl aminopeptidase/acylaminoacyl peptidase